MIRLVIAGGKPVIIEAKLDSDFKVSPAQIRGSNYIEDKVDHFQFTIKSDRHGLQP